ncbi:PAS domain-containing protein [Mesorhizobium sp. SB112]|uniref:hybrid sensor histidine kinase/response regulator n=1 Tax=Mesorhizobium sp. SB112 TaxID=3151853 RepID=UPI0032664C1C
MLRALPDGAIDAEGLFNASPNPYVVLDTHLNIVGMNEAYLAITMRQRDALLGVNMFEAFPSDPDSVNGMMLRQSLQRTIATKRVDYLPIIPYAIARADGSMEERFWSATHTPIFDAEGEVAFVLQNTVDVTELHNLRLSASGNMMQVQSGLIQRADAVVNENRLLGAEGEHLRSLFVQAPSFMAVVTGPEHVFDIANTAYLNLVGDRPLIGRKVRDAIPEVVGQGFVELLDEVYSSGKPYIANEVKVFLRRHEGRPEEERHVDLIYQPLFGEDDKITGIFVQGHDVTEQRKAKDAARESELRFRSLAQSMPNHVWTSLPDGQLDWFNDQVYQYSGHSAGELDGDKWAAIVHEDDRENAASNWVKALGTEKLYQTEFRLRRFDGSYRWHIARAVPSRGSDGNIVRWVGTNTDIEDQKRTEEQLEFLNTTLEDRVEERTAELLEAQAVLRQTQKMEAIGNLAGGIAHDFNNLLQVIGGNLQLVMKDFTGNELAERRLNNALSGVTRGAKLASQMLAFSRRQPLEPKVVNLGRLVRDMDHIIRRSIGEAIEIDSIVGGGLWNTLADPGNVENALLNLAINARDAMDGQGKLTIEAGNAYLDEAYSRTHDEVTPGQYVMLAVSDTGAGMTPEIIEKVFDPFFTTKPEGKGTGLGLSMVYGFVKQSNGHIKIYSEPGVGTTVKLYLPRSFHAEDTLSDVESGPLAGGSETILVAEDDEAVRDTTVALLSELGYRVLKAKDADSALTIVESGVPIDLLFTDVVMPGRVKSTELARAAKERLPNIGVLFTSGYTENSIVHGGRLDQGVQLLSKPYTREALARKVRSILARAEQEKRISPVSPKPVSLEGLRVLLCEDDAIIRMTTADMLQDMGVVVLEAGSATEAMALARTEFVHLLVTDVGLPDMSGVELADKIRAALPDLPVIFATGHSDVPGTENMPMVDILVKPYDEKGLLAAIARLVAEISR